jgi:putative redox protein
MEHSDEIADACCTIDAKKDKSSAVITWIGRRKFVGTAREHSVIVDQRLHEKGENTGFKPTELLLIAIGSCLGTTLLSMAEIREKKIDNLEINVEIERNTEGETEWLFNISVEIEGDFDKKEREEFVRSAEEICKISGIVRNPSEIRISVR